MVHEDGITADCGIGEAARNVGSLRPGKASYVHRPDFGAADQGNLDIAARNDDSHAGILSVLAGTAPDETAPSTGAGDAKALLSRICIENEMAPRCKALRITAAFRAFTDEVMQALVIDVFMAHPWAESEKLVLEVQGISIPIPYKQFLRHGRSALVAWHSNAIDLYLTDFGRACEYAADRYRLSHYGGWNRVRKWWPEFVRLSFRQNPFVPLQEMFLNHDGKRIANLYVFVVKEGDEDDIALIKDLYQREYAAYLEESFDHVVELIQSGRAFEWCSIPGKWQKRLLQLSFEQNPFTSSKADQFFMHEGQRVDVKLYGAYNNAVRRGEFMAMMTEVIREYLSTLKRVMQFYNHHNFFVIYGGWAIVPEKLKGELVAVAVCMAPNFKPGDKDLKFRMGEITVPIANLQKHYEDRQETVLFDKYIANGIARRPRVNGPAAAVPATAGMAGMPGRGGGMDSKNPKHDNGEPWVMRAVSDEKVREYITEARQTDNFEMVIRVNGGLILKYARKFWAGNAELRKELISEGKIIVIECARRFDFDRGTTFAGYLIAALINGFYEYRNTFFKGWLSGATRSHQDRQRELRLATGNPVVNLRDLSPEDIAEKIGIQVKTASDLLLATARVNRLDSDGPDDAGLHESIGANIADASDLVEEIDLMGNMSEIVTRLDTRSQVIIFLRCGIRGLKIDLDDLEKVVNPDITHERIIAAVGDFQTRMRDFCHTPQFEHEYAHDLEAIIERSADPADTIDAGNELGKALWLGSDLKLGAIAEHIIQNMDEPMAMIVSVLFGIPCDTYKYAEIGEFLGLSPDKIKYIKNTVIIPHLTRNRNKLSIAPSVRAVNTGQCAQSA